MFYSDTDFNLPDMETIVIPDVDFNFEEIIENINIVEEVDVGIEKMIDNGNLIKFKWKEGKHNVVVTSKEKWDDFKKSEGYKEYLKKNKPAKTKMFFSKNNNIIFTEIEKEHLKNELKKTKLEIKKINSEQILKELRKAKLQLKNIDKKQIREELEIIKKQLQKMKLNFSSSSNNIIIDGKKIKIKRRLEIKAPKSATFDLNTRHCKVTLPNTKASGKVSQGTFDVDKLNGGKLNINFSKVTINDLNGCTLFLNNVTDATLASVTNTTLNSSSSKIKINNINKNVSIVNEFGELLVDEIVSDFTSFNISLNHTNAQLPLMLITSNYKLNTVESKFQFPKNHNKDIFTKMLFKTLDNKTSSVKGELSSDKVTTNNIDFTSKYSVVKVN